MYDEVLKDYPNAIKWYKKAIQKGDVDAINNLAILYKEQKDYPNAIKWYKKAIKKGHIDARKSLGLLYHQQKDKLNSATYMMGMIGHPYTKERVLGLLRDDWKIDEPTLKKAYKLQKTLVPNPYTGGID
ncbi:tetratricopeptide repeat protein [Sulfurimonas sp.]|uniref:tetratricopeptide repeat protein n=1 Tax=Sulfurimonas sp. TaxID=2022749 RepID=UPI002B4997B1|nr:tetratricopeptide repeat protein [Sulfurimonas sp.]